MNKKIFIVLPFKESLNQNKSGAVSIFVKDTLKYSKFKDKVQVISSEHVGSSIFFKNKTYIHKFCKKYKNNKINIIEVHNRPEYVKVLKKNFPTTKIILTYHNDPQKLRGSFLPSERDYLLKNCEKIIFISEWIKQRFFSDLTSNKLNNCKIIYHGVKKTKKIDFKKKKKNILFVGKLNHNKGYDIFVDVAEKFKKNNPEWNFIAIGDENRKKIFPNKNIVKEIGYISNDKVLKYYEKSEIAIGNSKLD